MRQKPADLSLKFSFETFGHSLVPACSVPLGISTPMKSVLAQRSTLMFYLSRCMHSRASEMCQ